MAKRVFAVCQISSTRRTHSPCTIPGTRRNKGHKRRRPELTASGLTSSCASRVTHGEVLDGARPRWQHISPCARSHGTRQRIVSSPCAWRRHTVNCCHFAMCHGLGTRQSDPKQPVFFVFSRLKYPLKPYIIEHISQQTHAIYIYIRTNHKFTSQRIN